MKITQTDDNISIRYSERDRIFVGLWFIGLGLIGLLALPLLQLKPGDSWHPIVLTAALAVVIGGLAVGSARRQHTTIGRAEITIISKRYIGGATAVQTYKTSAVSSVEYVQFAIRGDTESSTDRGSTIYLNLQDGNTLKVASQRLRKLPFGGDSAGPLLDTAKQIANFLGVPLQQDPQHWRASE